MSKSLWTRYIEERLGQQSIERPWGFLNYKIIDNLCEICDLYVVPEEREQGRAWELFDELIEIAKESDCANILCYVWPGLKGSEVSIQTALAGGFKLHMNDGQRIILMKEIGGDDGR